MAKEERHKEVLRLLVHTLPKCTIDHCGNPATKAWRRGEGRYCDGHADLSPEEGIPPDYPRTPALREAQELLAEEDPPPAPPAPELG